MKSMRLALISYEYAGVGAGGGIGTYVRHAAAMMAARGHDVEVFCGGDAGTGVTDVAGVRVEAIAGPRQNFSQSVRAPFAHRHATRPFDVIEGPEYGADAAGVRADYPEVPLVVRLHTPSCMIGDINLSYVDWKAKARFIGGGLARGRLPKPWWTTTDNPNDPERLHTLSAERVVAPSQAILDHLVARWDLPAERSEVVPNAMDAPASLLSLSPAPASRTVLFLGKLEVRKGVIELAKAVPLVVQACPDVRFLFVGRDLPMPGGSGTVGEAMRRAYGAGAVNVTHVDAVDHSNVPDVIAQASVTVFPSIWENFPYVCLEAMAAARAVVASSAGGMAEIIEDGRTGRLVPPRDPRVLADAIIALLQSPDLVRTMGEAARSHVLATYRPDVVGPIQERSYRAAIAHAAASRQWDTVQ